MEMEGIPDNPRTETYTNFTNNPNPTTTYNSGSGEVTEERVRVTDLEEFQSYQFSVGVWNSQGSAPENEVMTICVRTEEDGKIPHRHHTYYVAKFDGKGIILKH